MATHTATAAALVVDTLTGEGGVVQLVVTAQRSEGGVVCRQRAADDTVLAVEVAVAAALGEEASRWRVEWELRETPFPVRGRSLGLAAAVAAAAAVAGREVPEGWAFTGAVELDGRVARVSSVPGKLRAAAEHEIPRVALPAANAQDSPPVEQLPVAHLSALLTRLLPPSIQWRRLAVPLLAPLLAAILAPTPLDLWLQAKLLQLTVGPLPADHTAVVLLPDELETASDREAGRGDHAGLIDDLAAAGVSMVAFDLDFSEPTEGDTALAEAVERAGVVVAGAVRWRDAAPRLPGNVELRSALTPALAQLEPEFRGNLLLGRMPVRQLAADGGSYWHLSVIATRARLVNPAPPRLSSGTLQVGARHHPLHRGRLYLHPVEAPMKLDYHDRSGWPDLTGRAVLVGVANPVDAWSTPLGPRHGVELHAAMIETLLAERVPRVLGASENALAAGIIASLAAALSRRGLAILVGVVLSGLVALLVTGPILPAPLLLLLAGILGRAAHSTVQALRRR